MLEIALEITLVAILDHEIIVLLGLQEVVEVDDVRVEDLVHDGDFTLEKLPLSGVEIGLLFLHHFNGVDHIVFGIDSSVDNSILPRAQFLVEKIGPDHFPVLRDLTHIHSIVKHYNCIGDSRALGLGKAMARRNEPL